MPLFQVIHVFKDNFPLLKINRKNLKIDGLGLDTIQKSLKKLILELEEEINLCEYAYIARHTDDNIPDEKVNKFIINEKIQNGNTLTIPTLHLVVYTNNLETIKNNLKNKNISYFEDKEKETNSINEIKFDPNYCKTNDSERFMKFLTIITRISLIILKQDKENEIFSLKLLEQEMDDEKLNKLLSLLTEYASINQEERKYIYQCIKDNNQWSHFIFNLCTP